MAKFHVNKETGETGACSAKVKCPFGDLETEHYTSKEAARAAYEDSQETFPTSSKNSLSELIPNWHRALPPEVEARIIKEITKRKKFLDAVASGKIGTQYAHVEEFLTPAAYAVRPRGSMITRGNREEGTYISLDDDTYYVALYTRQGGGNRECWCDDSDEDSHYLSCSAANGDYLESHPQFVASEDDSFDSTYATFYFDANLTADDIKTHKEHQANSSKANLYKKELQELSSGLPPWSILKKSGGSDKLAAYTNAKAKLERAAGAEKRLSDRITIIDNFDKVLKENASYDPAEITLLAREAGMRDWEAQRIPGYIETYKRAVAEHEKQKRMIAQAEALPPGDLRDYLVGDRGTGTYSTTEKQGRRNVKVTKTYQRGSLLGKELESTQRGVNNANTDLKPIIEKIKVLRKTSVNLLKEHKKLESSIEKVRLAAWTDGWPKNAGEPPAPPSDF